MRKLIGLLAILILAGCARSVGPTTHQGQPTGISVAGARGVYIQSGTAASKTLVRATMRGFARVETTSTGTTLGAVTPEGTPQTATFTDSNGDSVTVNIIQAEQLTSQHVLLEYSYSGGNVISILDMNSGALTADSASPDNWSNIFARGLYSWYISGGSLVRVELDNGNIATLSTGAETYTASVLLGVDSTDNGTSSPFDASTWVYADFSNNVYAVAMPGSSSIQAQVVKANGTIANFGAPYVVQDFINKLQNGLVLIDGTTGNLYLALGHEIYDNQPGRAGSGLVATGGYSLQLYPVTLDPSASAAISFNLNIDPIAWDYLTTSANWEKVTNIGIGQGLDISNSVLSNDDKTFHVTASSITDCDSSAIPHTSIYNGQDYGYGFIFNWKYSGGKIYAGPTSSSSLIAMLDLSGSTAIMHTLVNDPTTVSWSVVGGILFYTNSSGTFKATVDTTSGSIGPIQPYTGGTVTAITQ